MLITEFEAGHDGLHVPLTCENHPELRWSCKKIALSKDNDGKWRYNHSRNIFFFSDYPAKECDCPASKLYAIIEDI
jgi:hypothetical protein